MTTNTDTQALLAEMADEWARHAGTPEGENTATDLLDNVWADLCDLVGEDAARTEWVRMADDPATDADLAAAMSEYEPE